MFEADSTHRNVYVHHCPCEVPDSAIVDVLANFGSVHSVERCYYPGSPIRTGSRLIKMSLEGVIPSKLRVMSYPCRVWYRDQPQSCNICDDPAHRAAACPLRGLCRKCRQPGHFERGCPGSPSPAGASAASSASADPAASDSADSPASAALPVVTADDAIVADPDVVSSVDDGEMDDDALASGDEEVLAAAGHVSLSPRRTRSSSADVPADAAAYPVPDTASSDDGGEMDDSDLASGDEEVLATAGRVSLSPRRTRSSRAASCSPDPASSFVLPPSIPPSGVCVSVPSSSVAVPSPAVDACDSAPSSPVLFEPSPVAADPVPFAEPCDLSSATVSSPAAGDPVPVAEPCDLSDDVALDVVAASSRAFVLSAAGLGPFALSLFAVCPFRSGDMFSIADFGYTTRRIMSDTATFEMYRECHYTDRPGSVPVMSTFPSDRGPLPPDLVLDPSVLPSKFPGERSP